MGICYHRIDSHGGDVVKPHGLICHSCGTRARSTPLPEGSCATYHKAICFICKKEKSVTETRDFGLAHLTEKQIKERIKYDKVTCWKCGALLRLRKDRAYPQHVAPMSRAFRRRGRKAWDIDKCSTGGKFPPNAVLSGAPETKEK